MKRRVLTAIVAITALITLSLGGCRVPLEEEILGNVKSAFAQVEDYRGQVIIVTYLGSIEDRIEVTQHFKRPNMHRITITSPQLIEGQTTVYNGSTLWFYNPQDNEVIVFEDASSEMAELDRDGSIVGTIDALEGIEGDGGIEVTETKLPDGTQGYIISFDLPLQEQQSLVVRERILVSAETWLPLQVTGYDRNGNMVSKVIYQGTETNVGLDDSLFTFAPPPDATVRSSYFELEEIDIEEAQASVDFQLVIPTVLPEGFGLESINRIGQESEAAIVLHYTSEARAFSITESRPSDAQQLPEKEIMTVAGQEIGVLQGDAFTAAQWIQGDIEITIIGDATLSELLPLIESMLEGP